VGLLLALVLALELGGRVLVPWLQAKVRVLERKVRVLVAVERVVLGMVDYSLV